MNETDTAKTPQEVPRELIPVCPHCGQDPALVAARGPIKIGQGLFLLVFCGNPKCRKIFSANLLGMDSVRSSGLVIPGQA